jgi:altronate dehydratase
MNRDTIRLHPDDDVAVALRPLTSGETISVDGRPLTLRAAIPMAHKLALHPIAAGAPVRKYGEAIGEARAAIAAGDHVHVHNIVSRRARQSA